MKNLGNQQVIVSKIRRTKSFLRKRINGQYHVSAVDPEGIFHGGGVFGKDEGGAE